MDTPNTTSAAACNASPRRVRVLLPLPLADAYDYRVPAGLAVGEGDFVVVPLGARRSLGVVWGEGASAGMPGGPPGGIDESRLRDIEAVLPAPAMPARLRHFVDWVAAYTLSPPGSVMRMAMSVPEALQPPTPRTAYRRAGTVPESLRLTRARQRVLDSLEDMPPLVLRDLAERAGVSDSVIKGLAESGALETVALPGAPPTPVPDPDRPGPVLSAAQAAAAADLDARVAAHGFSVCLLDGVTGAGKTEVYFEAIAAALRQGRQVLVLLPEIALSAQWLERFADRFGVAPVEWHSDLPPGRRRNAWRAVATGRAKVVVGARSALFLPFPDLGLIVVDEEHDGSFKQDDGVAYHARDMAVVRGRIEHCPVALVTATPSLETAVNVQAGRYASLHLPARHGGAALPAIELVDLRHNPPERQSWLSPPLREALAETLAAGEQALLFLNRRGYAPLTLCRHCGHRLECPNCTAWLVEHRLSGRMQCHHCGFQARLPESCPECGTEGALVACGPGVERLAEEAGVLFPQARRAVLTSDTVHGPDSAAALVREMRDGGIDILIGTQIVAKGHHFPLLTLVGVVDADLGLNGGDLRAGERTYQLLHQVAGRAGRAERPGRVVLQTYNPDHPVMQALADGDRDRFLDIESEQRQAGGWPPFGRLAALIVSGSDGTAVEAAARALARSAPQDPTILVLGPAPAPLAMLRGRHRWRLLVKATRKAPLQRLLRDWIGRTEIANQVRVQVDIDPYNFL